MLETDILRTTSDHGKHIGHRRRRAAVELLRRTPDLPGCAGAGATVEACVQDMLDAIAFHPEGIAMDGERLPDGTGPGVYVERPPRTAA